MPSFSIDPDTGLTKVLFGPHEELVRDESLEEFVNRHDGASIIEYHAEQSGVPHITEGRIYWVKDTRVSRITSCWRWIRRETHALIRYLSWK